MSTLEMRLNDTFYITNIRREHGTNDKKKMWHISMQYQECCIVKILHLFFVDDVFIMTNGSLHEWKEIKDILNIFCSALGLNINWTKLTFHYAWIQEQSLELFKEVFPYNFIDLFEGFKYLGYFLKVDSYKATDWTWLVAKFEKRIGHRWNRWLSLGGRFTLIKEVLECQSIFWMALEAIPASVLDKIRKFTYNFLWSRCVEKTHFHLCSWDLLAKLKHKGGWGIINIFHFNRALAANSLWRVLAKEGIWHSVIKDNYLPHCSVAN